jgi:hypothetical protein
MEIDLFQKILRGLIYKAPFEPFFVELADGRHILVSSPNLNINEGAAGFLSDQDELVAFHAGEVRSIHPVRHETVS